MIQELPVIPSFPRSSFLGWLRLPLSASFFLPKFNIPLRKRLEFLKLFSQRSVPHRISQYEELWIGGKSDFEGAASVKNTNINIPMAKEILKLTVEIITSHASITELSTQELVNEIKDVYNLFASLEGGAVITEGMAPKKAEEVVEVKKPPIPLKDIV